MKLGLQIVDYTWAGGPAHIASTLTTIAQTAEASGFDMIAPSDHLWSSPWMGGREQALLESYTTLGYLAAATSRVRLMTLVTATPFRYPGLLGKIVTTLDVLSGGRAWLGIGAGHDEEEARGLGIPWPSLSERYEMLEEAIQVCLRMWSGEQGDETPFVGQHVHLERPLNVPQSLTRPHPPIMIAGVGERKTLRLVARYADACSLQPSPDIPHKLDVLRRHCEAEGRDYDRIEKTCSYLFDVGERGEKVEELIGTLRWLASMGIQTVTGRVPRIDQITPLEVIGREVIPAIADL
jgi:F420-dependent oxidoreductase-like protein